MDFPLINYTNLASCGTVTTATFSIPAEKTKCFKFKTMRDAGDSYIISKEEWDKFLEFVGAKKSNKPCDE